MSWVAVLLPAILCSCQQPHLPPSAPAPPPRPVSARIAGTVVEIRVAPGSAVQPGAWVATLAPAAPLPDPASLRRTLQDREANLSAARTDYLKTKQRVELGQAVFEDQLVAARKAFDAAQAARNEALSELESAQRATEQLRHYAPCAGTVVEDSVSVGQPVEAGAPILFIQPPP